ncbi:MAG: hypothetical protein AAEJ46_08910 [Planctomycetota bacterium]
MNGTDPQILTAALLLAASIQWIPARADARHHLGILKRHVRIRSRIWKG